MSSLLSHFPSLKLRSRDTKLRSGKRLHFAASCLAWATEPRCVLPLLSIAHNLSACYLSDWNFSVMSYVLDVTNALPCPMPYSGKRQAVEDQDSSCIKATAPPTICRLLALPDELLDGVLADKLDMQDLCAVSQTCTKFRSIGVSITPCGLALDGYRRFLSLRVAAKLDALLHQKPQLTLHIPCLLRDCRCKTSAGECSLRRGGAFQAT